jgi:hypothetical protein
VALQRRAVTNVSCEGLGIKFAADRHARARECSSGVCGEEIEQVEQSADNLFAKM